MPERGPSFFSPVAQYHIMPGAVGGLPWPSPAWFLVHLLTDVPWLNLS